MPPLTVVKLPFGGVPGPCNSPIETLRLLPSLSSLGYQRASTESRSRALRGPTMKIKTVTLLPLSVLSLALLALPCARLDAQTANVPAPITQARVTQARIIQALDEKNLVVLKGNVHPLARAEFDQGAVSDGQPLHRMLLLLQRGADQEAALQQLLDDQQNKSSSNYHAWLTPAQFGQQFGPADADIQTVANWLQSHGFQVTNITAGRTTIEFSGSAAQVRSAFHTEIHKYLVNGETRLANASDPQIPAALAPVVAGPVSLNNFPPKSHMRHIGTFQKSVKTGETKPLFTFPGCAQSCYGLGPADFAAIYNTAPLLSGTPKIDGTGQTIAIVGESDINVQDVTDFRTMFALPPNFSASNIIVNGADPGFNDSEGESDLDVQWSGAVAPGATIDFVTSQPTETTAGIFLSAIYIVENNLAGVMSESFGDCEQQIGTLNQFHNSLWEQAGAQGITVMVSAGDGGSAGCDDFDTAQTATHGLAVSGYASTPFNVAVGGTDFDQVNRWSQFWSANNVSMTEASALGYIPEIPWNDSCGQLGINGCGPSAPQGSLNIVAGSGGASTLYSKPSWQSGAGVPLDSHRDLPDVSLFASNGFDSSFYIVCQRDASGTNSCNLNDFEFTFQAAGGTSASAPAFAAMMALVNQKQATTQTPAPRQGNANYVLYQLFKKQLNTTPALNCNSSSTPASACTFNDVTTGNRALANSSTGNNDVPCTGASTNCSSKTVGTDGVLVTTASPSTPAYSTTTGYDLATGLGSVNAANLVNNWESVTFLPSTTTLSATVNGNAVTSITGIAHGTPVNLSSSVAAGHGSTGTPSGQIVLMATPNPIPGSGSGNFAIEALTLASGAASGTGVILPGGTYTLTSHYQGDGTFGSSDSTPGIPVNITSEPSKTLISIPTFDPNTGLENGNTPTTLAYGSLYLARIDVGNAQAKLSYPPQQICTPPACPTGTITWTDSLNSGPATLLDGGTFALNGSGFTEDQLINLGGGTHVLSANYGGDGSFSASSANYFLTITPVPGTQLSVSSGQAGAIVGSPLTLHILGIPGISIGANATGTVSVFDGSTLVAGPLPVACLYCLAGDPPDFSASVQLTFAVSGNHSITAQYSGDADYAAATSSVFVINALNATTSSVTAISSNVMYGATVTVTAIVDTNISSTNAALKPTGMVVFGTTFDGNINGSSVTATPDAKGNWELQSTATFTPSNTEAVTATYSGDPNYASSGSTISIQVNIPDFSLPQTTNITVTAGQSQTATINVAPLSANPSTVTLVVPTTQLPAGMTISFSPSTVNLNGASVPVTVTITTTGPSGGPAGSTMAEAKPRREPWSTLPWQLGSLASGLLMLLTFLIPRKRKSYRVPLLAGAVFFVCLALGCGGGSISGGTGSSGGPIPASVTLTTSNAKVATGQPFTLTVSVTSTQTPTGMVNIFAGQPPVGLGVAPPIQLVGGTATATVTIPPDYGGVGTYEFWAQYLGDVHNLPSQTTTNVEEVLTGIVPVQYTGQTGGLTHQGYFQITLQ